MNFVEKAKKIHENKFDYSKVDYKNNRTKIKIVCPLHGEFEQLPDNHLRGKGGCLKCNKIKQKEKFIQNAKKIHNNKYDYSKVNYVNNSTKVVITCPKHGDFLQEPSNHLRGCGCNFCAIDKNKIKQTLNLEDVLVECMKIHNNKYDYKMIKNYNNKLTPVSIICPEHGEFIQSLAAHSIGQGCPICKESKGEKKIRNWLQSRKIQFIQQKRFKKCKDKKPLPFDFYLPAYNICIEYDGRQHFYPTDFSFGKNTINHINKRFKILKEHDWIKTIFCFKNNLKLIRIFYSQKIESELNKWI